MKFTTQQLIDLEDPYHVLKDAETIKQNQDVFKELSFEERKMLASRVVIDCPQKNLGDLRTTILPFWGANEGGETFYTTLICQCDFKEELCGLLDETNNQPHKTILELASVISMVDVARQFAETNNTTIANIQSKMESDARTFYIFPKCVADYPFVALTILKGKESRLSERLALSTPLKDRKQVAENIKLLPELSSKFAAALKISTNSEKEQSQSSSSDVRNLNSFFNKTESIPQNTDVSKNIQTNNDNNSNNNSC